MKLTLEPTPDLVWVNGQLARFWSGTTDQKTPVYAVILMVAVPPGASPDVYEAFERELVEQDPRIIEEKG